MTDSNFPKDFLWGVSTSAHQVEGGNTNNWSEWERTHAKQSAKHAAQKIPNSGTYFRQDHLPNWEDFKTQAQRQSNYISAGGVDHFHRYKEDFDIAQSLNFNAFRFGIEWSRIEPEEGKWNDEAIEHYRSYIAELRSRGLEPMLNIWHWTQPVWFENKGAFTKSRNLRYFDRFVQKIADELLDDLNYVITLNEPNVYATFGYVIHVHPPGEHNVFKSAVVYCNLLRAHRRAYRILKIKKPKLWVGIAQQLANIQAKRPHNVFDQLSTKIMRFVWNWSFLTAIRGKQDFVGINYYFTDYYTGLMKRHNPKVPLNDLGWYMEPEGLYPLLLRAWARYKKPIIVTENGVADSKDQYRQWWIQETIIAMERAISEGVDLRGYFHWSLLDNFEWSDGWWPKFGLVAVDREHDMKRTIRPSARWWADYLKHTRQL